MRLAYVSDSLVQHPEQLYKDRKLSVLVAAAFLLCVALLFVDLPAIRDFFLPRYQPSAVE